MHSSARGTAARMTSRNRCKAARLSGSSLARYWSMVSGLSFLALPLVVVVLVVVIVVVVVFVFVFLAFVLPLPIKTASRTRAWHLERANAASPRRSRVRAR